MTITLRAHFDGKAFVPEEPVQIALNQPVNLRVETIDAVTLEPDDVPGSPAALARVMASLPRFSADEVRSFEQSLHDAKLPPSDGIDFDARE